MSMVNIRVATLGDIDAIEALIEASVRALQAADYTPEQIERSLRRVFGVDRRLILDGTYFVGEVDGNLAACGGWSYRRTLFGADAIDDRDDTELKPSVDAAKIRAFFVAPAWARRGLATRLLAVCEAAAAGRGFTELELGSTLTGEPLYARCGYRAIDRLETSLGDGTGLQIVRMTKSLAKSGLASSGLARSGER